MVHVRITRMYMYHIQYPIVAMRIILKRHVSHVGRLNLHNLFLLIQGSICVTVPELTVCVLCTQQYMGG